MFDLRRVNGGTMRVGSFSNSLRRLGWDVVEVCPIDPSIGRPSPTEGAVRQFVTNLPVGQRRWPAWVRTTKRLVAPLPSVWGAYNEDLVPAILSDHREALLIAPFPLSCHLLTHGSLWADFHDVHSRYARREAAHGPRSTAPGARIQSIVYSRQERKLLDKCVAASAAGYGDAQQLASRSKSPVQWIPSPLGLSYAPSRPPGQRCAGFIGDFRYGPNVDALHRLLEQWLTTLRAEGWNLLLAGHGSDEIPLPPGVVAMGAIATPSEFYAAIDIALAPVELGGGIKIKVLEALANNRPIICTRFAVDGLSHPLPSGILLADTVAELRESLRALADAETIVDLPSIYTESGFDARVSETLDLISRS